jgi:hypothetical protein
MQKEKFTEKRKLTSNQKFMVFLLSMSIFGLSDLVTKIVPDIVIGPVELGISYFAFIAVTFAILFDPLTVAVGSAFGAVIFGGLLMGKFGGIGEIEGFLQLSMAIFIGGMAVSNPLNKKQIAIAAMLTVGFDKFVGGLVDIGKVVIGVAEMEAVKGLPESILVIEGVAFVSDFVVAGILFGAIPAMSLVPKLYGKIEPLLGMEPRIERPEVEWKKILTLKNIGIAIALSLVSAGVAFLDEMDIKFGEWAPKFEKLLGGNYIYLAIGISVVITMLILTYIVNRAKNKSLEKI